VHTCSELPLTVMEGLDRKITVQIRPMAQEGHDHICGCINIRASRHGSHDVNLAATSSEYIWCYYFPLQKELATPLLCDQKRL